jgi:uracil-DNA glycosylase
MKNVKITVLIGQYSQKLYLKDKFKPTLTENVRNYLDFLPTYLPLVHPSPRNKIWHTRNPWFEIEIVPKLREIVKNLL